MASLLLGASAAVAEEPATIVLWCPRARPHEACDEVTNLSVASYVSLPAHARQSLANAARCCENPEVQEDFLTLALAVEESPSVSRVLMDVAYWRSSEGKAEPTVFWLVVGAVVNPPGRDCELAAEAAEVLGRHSEPDLLARLDGLETSLGCPEAAEALVLSRLRARDHAACPGAARLLAAWDPRVGSANGHALLEEAARARCPEAAEVMAQLVRELLVRDPDGSVLRAATYQPDPALLYPLRQLVERWRAPEDVMQRLHAMLAIAACAGPRAKEELQALDPLGASLKHADVAPHLAAVARLVRRIAGEGPLTREHLVEMAAFFDRGGGYGEFGALACRYLSEGERRTLGEALRDGSLIDSELHAAVMRRDLDACTGVER